jgi:TolB-like protein
VQTRAPASALRATAGHLAAELTERSSRSGGLPPAREYKPEALAAMGEGLLHLARRDVTAAGRAFAEGATLDSTHTVLLRAARVTAPFVDAPLPGVAVNEFVGHYGPDPEGARGLGRGISEMLLTDLVQAGFRIVDRSVVEHLEREQDLPNTALAGTGVRPGRIVPARYLVEGTVLVVGDSMDIEAQLVDAESGVALALPVQRASTASIFDAVVRLGWIIGREIRKQPSAVADGDLLALADLLDELGLGDLATAYRSMVGGP